MILESFFQCLFNDVSFLLQYSLILLVINVVEVLNFANQVSLVMNCCCIQVCHVESGFIHRLTHE